MDMRSILTSDTPSELVGTTLLDTIALVIPSVSPSLLENMNLEHPYRSLGVFSSRTGAAGQINAIDEAVKSTNTDVLTIQLPRDTKGWGGHGNFIVLGGGNVADVRQAMEIALSYTERYAGELYLNDAGHLEFTYSARAGAALNYMFGAPLGRAFGFMCGSPAAIGLLMADRCVKAADVEVLRYMTPDVGTSHSNEVIIAFSGDASAVKTAIIAARETGLSLLRKMGGEPKTFTEPYI